MNTTLTNAFATVFPRAIPVVAITPTGDKPFKGAAGGFRLPVHLDLANGAKTVWSVYATKKKDLPNRLAGYTATTAAGRFAVELDSTGFVTTTVTR
jgi:hypothetical protein